MVKKVGKNGQICIGKTRTGERLMVPADQACAYTKETQAVIEEADRWCAENPPRRFTPEQLEAAKQVEFPE
jgi:hypothetical protein